MQNPQGGQLSGEVFASKPGARRIVSQTESWDCGVFGKSLSTRAGWLRDKSGGASLW